MGARTTLVAVAATGVALMLGGCSSAVKPDPTAKQLAARTPSKPAKRHATRAKRPPGMSRFGVPASPRVVPFSPSKTPVSLRHGLPRRTMPSGGGVYKVGNPYRIAGKLYVPRPDPTYDKVGMASWYGDDFHGRKTANGEIYDMWSFSAAHPTLPLPSYAYVTNLVNNRTVLVRINDRGPYAYGRIIDLSKAVSIALAFKGRGVVRVRVRYAGRAPLDGNDARERRFLVQQPWARRAMAGRSPAPAYGTVHAAPLPAPPPAAPLAPRQPAKVATPRNRAHRAPRTAAAGVPAARRTWSAPHVAPQALTKTPAQPQTQPQRARQPQFYSSRHPGLPRSGPHGFSPRAPSAHYVLAGTYRDYGNAVRMRDRLRALGRTLIHSTDVRGVAGYRVLIGPVNEHRGGVLRSAVRGLGVVRPRLMTREQAGE
ncbi:MAG: septal ring lytic transglycosylase RlpA family protein [Pseudomonadota bacterium]